MKTLPYGAMTRIILRYLIGLLIGKEAAEVLAGDPDIIIFGALILAVVIEAIYVKAVKRKVSV